MSTKIVNGKKVEKTPQEIKQEQEAGQKYISDRERLANQRGVSSKEAARGMTAIAEGANPPLSQLEAQARLDLERRAAAANVQQAAIQQELANMNANQNPNAIQSQTGNAGTIAGNETKTPMQESPIMSNGIKAPLRSGEASNALINPIPALQAISPYSPTQTIEGTLMTAAQIYDTIQSSLFASKSTDVKKAEAAFADASFLIDKDIALVKSGQKTYTEAQRNFALAEAAVNRLEGTTKGLGKVNLRYWLDNGAELQAQIIREKATLDNQRIELENARLQSSINTAKTNIGL